MIRLKMVAYQHVLPLVIDDLVPLFHDGEYLDLG